MLTNRQFFKPEAVHQLTTPISGQMTFAWSKNILRGKSL